MIASGGKKTKSELASTLTIGGLLVVAIAFGGGGTRYAMANLVVQLAALVVLAIRREAVFEFWRSAPGGLRILVGLSLLLPAAQLLPLPPSVWMTLPGRDLVAQSFELVGRSGWAPASVDPIRTLVALGALVTPFAVLAGGWTLPKHQLLWLGWVVVALGLINFLVGVPQVVSDGTAAILYGEPRAKGVLYGTFANRNTTGIFLVGALSLAALLPAPLKHPAIIWGRVAICALLLVGVLLTRSRTALVLAAIPLGLASIRAIAWSMRRDRALEMNSKRASLLVLLAIALGVSAIGTTVTIAPGRVADTIDRFEAKDDARRFIWEDAAYSVSRYWPVGAGMGTFDEVFQVDESLENATLRRAGRAHNDYLEIAIEAGIAGAILVALWLALIGWFSWRARLSRSKWTGWAAAGFLLAIALQSITDYPLRNQSMLAIAACMMLLLARSAFDRQDTAP